MTTLRRFTIGLAILAIAGVCVLDAKKKGNGGGGTGGANFDYYLLTLSWAPDFCDVNHSTDPNECGVGKHVGFVVHGLWPQHNGDQGPQNCGAGAPVPQAVVDATLPYVPTAYLINHEWGAHGTCSGLSVEDYFATLRKARDSVQIPAEMTSLSQTVTKSASDVQGWFAAANPSFPATAFRATCTKGELQEARICLDKNLKAQACTASAGSCSSSFRILPPR